MKVDQLAFETFRLDRANALLWRGAERIALAPKPFEVLCVLVDRCGELVTKDELLDAVWSNLHVSESSLSVAINAVRLALGDDPSSPRFIETVTRRGFRFIAPVTVVSDKSSKKPEAERRAFSIPIESNPRWWVGRSGPLEAMESRLEQVVAGHRQVIFLAGEAGIGKTTFIEMLAENVSQRGFGILWGRCVEQFGTDEAFLPLIEPLQEHCLGSDALLSRETLRAYAPTWLIQMPGLLDARERAALQKEVFGATRERMLREFCELMEYVSSQRPWIVILEDMHWGDYATLDILSLLAQRQQKASILVIVSYRPGDVLVGDHPIRTVHQELQIHGRCTEITLDRLTLEEVEQYLQLRFGEVEMTQALAAPVFKRTEGHPLFMVALIDYLVAEREILKVDGRWKLVRDDAISEVGIPRNLKVMIGYQIDRLTAEEQRLLEAASASGMEFSAAVAASVLDCTVPTVEQVCEQLARKGQILMWSDAAEWPDGTVAGRYMFQHALYQAVLYQRLAPGQQIHIHRRTGERLEAAYGEKAAEISTVLALHFERGRDVVRAVRYLEQAAESSRKRFANREAETYLTRALGLLDGLPAEHRLPLRIRLLRQRGRVRQSASDDIRHALSDIFSVVSSAAEAGQLDVEVIALLDLCRYSAFVDRQLCLDAAEKALNRSSNLEDKGVRALAQGNHALANIFLKGWEDDAADRYHAAIKTMTELGEPKIATRAIGIKAIVEIVSSNYQESYVAAKHCKLLAREHGDVFLFSLYGIVEAWSLLHLGSWRELRNDLPAALEIMEKNANRPISNPSRFMVAWLHVEALDFEGAKGICEEAIDSVEDENHFSYFLGRTLLAKAYVGLHDLPAALAHFNSIVRRIEVDGVLLDSYCYPIFYQAFCEYWLAAGDLLQAQAQARRLYEFARRAPERTYLALSHRLLAKIAISDGNFDGARMELSHAISILHKAELPLAAWKVYATAAEFHERVGEAKDALECRSHCDKVIASLAATLEDDDPLRASLLDGYAAQAG